MGYIHAAKDGITFGLGPKVNSRSLLLRGSWLLPTAILYKITRSSYQEPSTSSSSLFNNISGLIGMSLFY